MARTRLLIGICFVTIILGACDVYLCLYPTSSLTIRNSAGKAIVAVFVVPQEEALWGDNLLPEIIPSGGELILEGIEKDEVKIKVNFDDGIFVTKEKVDLREFEMIILNIELGEDTNG